MARAAPSLLPLRARSVWRSAALLSAWSSLPSKACRLVRQQLTLAPLPGSAPPLQQPGPRLSHAAALGHQMPLPGLLPSPVLTRTLQLPAARCKSAQLL